MATQSRDWIGKANYGVLILVACALPIMSQAGGLGIAAIAAIGALGLRPSSVLGISEKVPTALWLVMALLTWGLISSLWSPYHTLKFFSRPMILALGVPLFLGCALALHQQAQRGAKILLWIFVGGAIGSAFVVLLDLLTNFGVTNFIDPLGANENPDLKAGDMVQNIGHATSVLSVLLAPIVIILWTQFRGGKILAAVYTAAVFAAAYKVGVASSLLACGAALIFMLIAVRAPKFALNSAFAIAGASLAFAPLLAYAATKLTPAMRAGLPFSWEERVVNWSYLSGKIGEHPLIGHGFDAVRTFNETHTIRGFDGRALVSLHPHNAGLHLWVEVGFVGVALACAALFFGARALTKEGALSKPQMIAASGLAMAAIVISNLSYGVWQDWWWASIIIAGGLIAFLKPSSVSI